MTFHSKVFMARNEEFPPEKKETFLCTKDVERRRRRTFHKAANEILSRKWRTCVCDVDLTLEHNGIVIKRDRRKRPKLELNFTCKVHHVTLCYAAECI